MKKEVLERANKLAEAIHLIGVVLNDIRSGKDVYINTSHGSLSIAPFRKEMQQIMADTLVRMEDELERL